MGLPSGIKHLGTPKNEMELYVSKGKEFTPATMSSPNLSVPTLILVKLVEEKKE